MTAVTLESGGRHSVASALVAGDTFTIAGRLPKWATGQHQLFVAGRRVIRITARESEDAGWVTSIVVTPDDLGGPP
jgi:hypothetical protein